MKKEEKIMKWYITGDTHGDFSRFKEQTPKEKMAVIILGDSAVNWNLDKNDWHFKNHLTNAYPDITWYLLRGNHDARPTAVSGIREDWDDDIQGYVLYEPEFLNIRYLRDGGEYIIDGFKVLTIGGAYSVDKWYRLRMGYRWFEDEQLTENEMRYIETLVKGKHYDIVLTHTCPHSWRPTDLFLPGLDQNSVDNTMERWLDNIKDIITWDLWLFGHYHADRVERPHVEQFYKYVDNIQEIWDRWHGDPKEQLRWIRKSPNYYMYI